MAAGSLVFTASAAVLILEIIAARLLAPYVGLTLETYTGIIGTVLAGIALGNWLGGRLADRVDPRRLLGPLVTAGGVLALLAPTAVATLGSGVRGADPVAVLVLAVGGFFAPAVALSTVTPTVITLQLDSLDETGSVVGWLSALATAGAIAGTFATGFALVATLASRTIVLVVGAGLVAVGLVLWGTLHPRGLKRVTPVVALALLAGAGDVAIAGPCDVETAYYCATVVAEPGDPSRRLLLLDRVRHSHVDVDDPTHLEFSYARTVADVLAVVAPPGRPVDVLHVGGGGFTLPRYLTATRPGSTNVVLELDPELVALARRQLGLVTGPDLRVETGDARLTLRREPRGVYDVVVGDAFGGLAVPWHLTTVEFLEQVRGRLEPGGVYVMNLIDFPPLGFARAEVATLREVFDHVAVLAPPARLAGRAGGNFVLVASDRPVNLAGILARNADRGDDEAALVGDRQLTRFVDRAPVLTDAYAPVDQLLTPFPS